VLIQKNVIYFPDYFDHEEHEGLEDILLVPTRCVGMHPGRAASHNATTAALHRYTRRSAPILHSHAARGNEETLL
jgi:hypothetical protein